MAQVEVLLVDGMGNIKVLSVEGSRTLPRTIPFPHPKRTTTGVQVIAQFDLAGGDVDEQSRPIYRQRDCGNPPIRFGKILKPPPVV